MESEWSDRVRTHCHVSVAHTLILVSQDPDTSHSPVLVDTVNSALTVGREMGGGA